MASNDKTRIVFTGGGSGGHVYPLIAVIEELQKELDALRAPAEFSYLGPDDSYSVLFSNIGLAVYPISSGKVRRYFSMQNLIDIPKFFIGFVQALFRLYIIMPDLVFSKGGTGALPVVMAAWFYRIPIAIHDSDARPGMTNVVSGRFAAKVFLTFERAASSFDPKKTEITGLPLRQELLGVRMEKPAAKENLGFEKDQFLVVILGGSQGAVRINEFILQNLSQLVGMTQVLHQTGAANFLEVKRLAYAALVDLPAVTTHYVPIGYFEKESMATALMAADVVVARSGSSVCELASFGAPAILIPLAESANGHQRADAYEFAKSGAGIVIEEANLLPGIFFDELKKMLSNPDLRAQMSAASASFFIPDAAKKISASLIAMLAGR
jgi:UDP-N-acetylglucosamine--N-acetylmuramyl-(pentapeptide) pyrophosphoryl-undecaprenol N-acetylglucosamine transferase